MIVALLVFWREGWKDIKLNTAVTFRSARFWCARFPHMTRQQGTVVAWEQLPYITWHMTVAFWPSWTLLHFERNMIVLMLGVYHVHRNMAIDILTLLAGGFGSYTENQTLVVTPPAWYVAPQAEKTHGKHEASEISTWLPMSESVSCIWTVLWISIVVLVHVLMCKTIVAWQQSNTCIHFQAPLSPDWNRWCEANMSERLCDELQFFSP